ncbi:UNVERIFIED_CONTAM: hypothetical protein RMT77_014583 [Armadillidium vulgare]
MVRWDRKEGSGGGLLILIHQSLHFRKVDLQSYPNGKLETLAIKVSLLRGWTHFLLCHNPCKDVPTKEFDHYISQLCPPLLFVGDFNAHHQHWEPGLPKSAVNKTGLALHNFLTNSTNLNLLTPPGMPTRINPYNALSSTLDLVIGSPTFQDLTFHSGRYLGSDHLPVILTFPQKQSFEGVSARPRWRLSEDARVWNEFSCNTNFILDDNRSLEESVDSLNNTLKTSASRYFTLTSGKFGTKPRHLWWNESCKQAVKVRNAAFNKWRSNPNVTNCINYRKKAASCRHIIIKQKRDSWRQLTSKLNFSTSAKEAWSVIRKMSGTYIPQNFPLTVDGGLLVDAFSKAEAFALHYRKIFSIPDPLENRGDYKLKIQNAIDSDSSNDGMAHPFLLDELNAAMHSLKHNKAMGFDYIPNEFLSHLNEDSLRNLLQLFNNSWTNGIYPKPWKKSVILPFLKPAKDDTQPESYRAINLLPCPGKLMEKMVNGRLVWWLEKHGFQLQTQYGFRPGMSTIDCLLHLENIIHGAYHKKQYALILSIDLKSAFDSSSHIGILYKLAKAQIRGTPLKWLQNFLVEREFSVSVQGTLSAPSKITCGVPQGSVLSPTLFSILISDLAKVSPNILAYADDIVLYVASSDLHRAQLEMQKVADSLQHWTKQWGLQINPSKSSLSCFTKKRIPFIPSITIDSQIVPQRSNFKFLGLFFDAPHLTWKNHIAYLLDNCSKRLNIMRRVAGTSWGPSTTSLLHLYTSYIRSKIDYGSVLYGSGSLTRLRQLDTIQNTALRIALGAFKSSPVPALQIESGIPSLAQRRRKLLISKFTNISTAPESSYLHLLYKQFILNSSSLHSSSFIHRAYRASQGMIPSLPEVVPILNISVLPPYFQNQIIYDTEISTQWHKGDTPQMALGLYSERINRTYGSFLHVYTDGSKISQPVNSTSSAMYFPTLNITTTWKLEESHTVLFAELFAIYKALSFIIQALPPQKVVICTDSMSSIHVIKSKIHHGYKKIHTKIQECFQQLALDPRWLIHFLWVPSHIGILNNEIADAAAKLGHNLETICIFPLENREILTSAECALQQEIRRENNDFLSLHPLGQFYLDDNCISFPATNRRLETAMFRLRVGHTGLKAHLHKLKLAQSPSCPHCAFPTETVEHFLIHCPQYMVARNLLFSRLRTLGVSLINATTLLALNNVPPVGKQKAWQYIQQFLRQTGNLYRI